MLGRGLESLIPPQKDNSELKYKNGELGIQQKEKETTDRKPQFNPKETRQTDKSDKTDMIDRAGMSDNVCQLTVKEPVFNIEVEKIKPNPFQPRRNFNEEELKELADSLKEYGILQPLVVSKIEKEVPWGQEVEYQLIAGHRRLLAAKLVGFKVVPAIVRENPEERQKLEIAVIENIQRTGLNPIEMARAFAKLTDEFGLPQREIANRLGKSREAVANTIRLLQLPFEAQKALSEDKINESHARVILALQNPEKQRALLGEILSHNLSVREAELIAKRFLPQTQDEVRQIKEGVESGSVGDPLLKQIIQQLEERLAVPVTIRQRGDKGKITINFYSKEDLQKILDKFSIIN